MAAATMSAPPAGEFPVSFGNSFFDRNQEPTHWSLRYDFKPASVSSAASGKIRMGNDNQVCLDLLNKQSGQGELTFNGHSERYDGLDCVAVFDGQCWRLEMLAGSVKVRHVKSQNRSASGRLPTPPPAAAREQATPMQIAAPAHQLPAHPVEPIHTQAEEQGQARDLSQEPSDQQRSTADVVAVSPSTSSDTSTDRGADSGEEEGQYSALHPPSSGMSPSPRAVVASPAHRQEQAIDGHHTQQNGHAMPPGMTDLERQFFATQSPSSDSSSSDSDESNEGSEDNENDGFEHF